MVFANLIEKRKTSLFSGIWREIRKKSQILKKNAKFDENEKIENSIIQSRKNVDDFWLKFWDWRTVQRIALCRSWRELSNEFLLDEIGVDTAENEPLEVWGKIIQYYSFVSLLASQRPSGLRRATHPETHAFGRLNIEQLAYQAQESRRTMLHRGSARVHR